MKKFLCCLLMFVMLSSCSKVYTSRFITGDQFKDAIRSEVNFCLSEIISQLNSLPKTAPEPHWTGYLSTFCGVGTFLFLVYDHVH
jgi:hypothetical protein